MRRNTHKWIFAEREITVPSSKKEEEEIVYMGLPDNKFDHMRQGVMTLRRHACMHHVISLQQ